MKTTLTRTTPLKRFLLGILTALLMVGIFSVKEAVGQTYYDMSTVNYSQEFNGITTLPTNFSLVGILPTGTIPEATRTTTASTTLLAVVGSGAAVGIDATTSTRLVFLTTGAAANTTAIASDLNLNFTGRNAGNLSYFASTIFNSTGNRVGSLRIYYSVDNTSWTELLGSNLPYVATNNVTGSGSISIALPAALNNQATVKLRFYYHNGNANGTTGSRPRIGIDDLLVTSTPAPTATLTQPSALSGLDYTGAGPSSWQSYTFEGSNLTGAPGDIAVTGTTNFEVSSDGITAAVGNTYNVAYASSTLASTTTYVRLRSGLAVATYGPVTGVTLAGGGATTINVSTTGIVSSASPTFSFSPTSITTLASINPTAGTALTTTISGANLSPASGNITITAPTGFQVSKDDLTWLTSETFAYTGGNSFNASNNTIYFRISAGVAVGPVSGSATTSGGGVTTPPTIVLSGIVSAASVALLQWNTFGNAGTETTEPSVFNDVNLFSSNLTQGSITAAANGNRFGGSGWFNTGNTVAGNTLAEAVTGGDYIQFIVSPNSGFSFTPTSFDFIWDRSGTGPSSATLRSSADGFVGNLGTVIGMISGGAATTTTRTINITGLTNLTAATTFRLYGYGATVTGGTGGFDVASNVVNVALNGSTASTSGPSITTSGNVTGLSYIVGTGPSAGVPVTISAASLTAGGGLITFTESTNFEISTTSPGTSGYGTTATLTYTGTGSLAANTVWVRLKAGLPGGTYSPETISISGGAATSSFTASGNVVSPSIAVGIQGSTFPTTLDKPSLRNIIYQSSFAVTVANATLNGLTVPTAGTYLTTDLTASAFRLWYNVTSTDFYESIQLGTSVAPVVSGGNVVFTGLSQVINSGQTARIWVTVDIAAGAVTGRTIFTAANPFTNFTFATAVVLTGTNPVAASAAQTFVGNSPTFTGVIVPQFIQGITGTNNTRIPYVYRASVAGLSPATTYRYFNQVVTPNDAGNVNGAGNAIYPSAGKLHFRLRCKYCNRSHQNATNATPLLSTCHCGQGM